MDTVKPMSALEKLRLKKAQSSVKVAPVIDVKPEVKPEAKLEVKEEQKKDVVVVKDDTVREAVVEEVLEDVRKNDIAKRM